MLPLLSALTASQRVTSLSLLLLVLMARLANSEAAEGRPKAFVYYGPHDSFKLSQSVGELLESSPHNFEVEYVSPENITTDLLATGKVFAYPGGYDVQESWDALETVAPVIRDYVANGGRYIGFCLGAYMASDSPGLGFLPQEAEVDAECDQKGAQVPDARDTVIQVDWRFSSGPNAGKTVKDRWIYYQEGNLVKDFPENSTSFVIARYSTTGHIAATLNKYGDGWVGTTGPHPEANQSWFDEYNITAPDGLQYEIGWDLIEATMSGGQGVTTLSSSGNQPNSNAPSRSDGASTVATKSGDTSTATSVAPAKSAGSRRRSNPLRRLFGR